MTSDNGPEALRTALATRFEDAATLGDAAPAAADDLAGIVGRGSVRHFTSQVVAPELLRLLSAVALSAPTKSDLQQRDIVIVTDPELRAALNDLVSDQPWTAAAPALLVFCGNNRRQRLVHGWRGHSFVNDHLDAFFNAAVDAGIALSAFVLAAERLGLGCCPISALRNDPEEVSRLLGLPDHVFPVAGLTVGWPAQPAAISPRLPLALTLHENRYREDDIESAIARYDHRRNYAKQRDVESFGAAPFYGWSEDKARQYARPERAGFGAFVRAKGFKLD